MSMRFRECLWRRIQGSSRLQLSAPAHPQGVCSDASGNVFIDVDPNVVYEYRHGGTTPVATLRETSNYVPFDCASDPTTGNLAVADLCYGCGQGGQGSVAIFQSAQGTPTRYTDPQMTFPKFVGFG